VATSAVAGNVCPVGGSGELHLPKLRAALDARFTANVSTACQD
jgi:hypothetical protein